MKLYCRDGIVIATHDLPLISMVPQAQLMRLDKGRLIDPTGSLRYPPGQAQSGHEEGRALGKPG